ncbi:hypothetical protein SYNPS1DRAFT_3942, partial [Syncephalis pseudoplumigaleata]
VFCVPCADNAFGISLLCPLCQTSLTANNDIVLVELNPTEDYNCRSLILARWQSVLAGQRPDVIADVCQRALSFWNYQMTQELSYQEMMRRAQENRHRQLEEQMKTTIANRNGEIA